MVEIRTLYLCRGSPGDGKEFLDRGLPLAALEAFVPFPKSCDDGPRQRFSSGFGNGLSQAMRFRVFDIQAHFLPFCIVVYLSLLSLSVAVMANRNLRGISTGWYMSRRSDGVQPRNGALVPSPLAAAPPNQLRPQTVCGLCAFGLKLKFKSRSIEIPRSRRVTAVRSHRSALVKWVNTNQGT